MVEQRLYDSFTENQLTPDLEQRQWLPCFHWGLTLRMEWVQRRVTRTMKRSPNRILWGIGWKIRPSNLEEKKLQSRNDRSSRLCSQLFWFLKKDYQGKIVMSLVRGTALQSEDGVQVQTSVVFSGLQFVHLRNKACMWQSSDAQIHHDWRFSLGSCLECAACTFCCLPPGDPY